MDDKTLKSVPSNKSFEEKSFSAEKKSNNQSLEIVISNSDGENIFKSQLDED